MFHADLRMFAVEIQVTTFKIVCTVNNLLNIATFNSNPSAILKLFFYSKRGKIQGSSLKTIVIVGSFFENTGKIFKMRCHKFWF
jgi:hypothetical protein